MTAPSPDIPALHEQHVIIVSTVKAKEAIGIQLKHEQVKQLNDKYVERHHKRYETYVGAKTTETLTESFLMLATKVVGAFVRLKDAEALQNELKYDYIITKELSAVVGGLALRCGQIFAVANAVLITTNHIDFSAEQQKPEQSSATAE